MAAMMNVINPILTFARAPGEAASVPFPSSPVCVLAFPDIPFLDLLPCPRCLAEKRETGLYARIHLKTADGDSLSHLGPAISRDQMGNDGLQLDAVQRIARMDGR
jgi:hypothetical protein